MPHQVMGIAQVGVIITRMFRVIGSDNVAGIRRGRVKQHAIEWAGAMTETDSAPQGHGDSTGRSGALYRWGDN